MYLLTFVQVIVFKISILNVFSIAKNCEVGENLQIEFTPESTVAYFCPVMEYTATLGSGRGSESAMAPPVRSSWSDLKS